MELVHLNRISSSQSKHSTVIINSMCSIRVFIALNTKRILISLKVHLSRLPSYVATSDHAFEDNTTEGGLTRKFSRHTHVCLS